MAIRIVRLGSAREPEEGLRIGTVRRPPRGVRKADYARRDYFDVWLPELAPSAGLVSWAFSEPLTPKRWSVFERRYRREMAGAESQRILALLGRALAANEFLSGLLLRRRHALPHSQFRIQISCARHKLVRFEIMTIFLNSVRSDAEAEKRRHASGAS